MALVVLLDLKGVEFVADEAETVEVILALAAGDLGGEGLARWIRANRPA